MATMSYTSRGGYTHPGQNPYQTGGIVPPWLLAQAQAQGTVTGMPGPSTGGYSTAPPASPTSYSPSTGGYIPPGGGSPFPYNTEAGGVGFQQTPGGYFRPKEFERPATPYPGASTSGSDTVSKKSSGAGRGVGAIPPYVYIPPRATIGTGAYWPGDDAVDIRRGMEEALMHANRHSGGLAFPNAPGGKAGAGYSPAQIARMQGGSSGGSAGSYQSAFDEARAENEARYRDILTGLQDRYERNMEDLRGSGIQEREDINEVWDRNAATQRQNIVGRGLGNSSVLDTMLQGNAENRNDNLGRAEERLRQQRIALDAGLSGDVLSFMERRTDSYPDLNLMAQLAQQMGAAGYGQQGGGAQVSAPNQGAVGPLTQMIPMGGGGYLPPSGWGMNAGRPSGRGSYNRDAASAHWAAVRAAEEAERARRKSLVPTGGALTPGRPAGYLPDIYGEVPVYA